MADKELPTPPNRKYSWLILGAIFLSLPLAFLGLREFFDLLGLDFRDQYVALGLWLGLGVAGASIFGSRVTGGDSAPTSRSASVRWVFVVWAVATAALLVWALMPGAGESGESSLDRIKDYLAVVQVLLTIAIAIWIFRNQHRGRRFVILAIIGGAAFIGLFAAATGYFL